MTYSAFDVLVGAARHLDGRDGTVTSAGSANTITDTNWSWRTQPADIWKGGTYFQKKTGTTVWNAIRIAFSSTAGVVILTTNLPATPAAGDAYVLLGNAFPATILLQKLISFIDEYGDTITQNTSLLTVANQREYTIPDTATAATRVVRVEVQSEGDQYRYNQALGVEIDDARGKIVFPYPQAAGLTIRLTLRTSNRTEYSLANLPDMPDHISPDWAALEVAARVARWRLMQSGEDAQKDTVRTQDLLERAARARTARAPFLPRRQPRLSYTEVS